MTIYIIHSENVIIVTKTLWGPYVSNLSIIWHAISLNYYSVLQVLKSLHKARNNSAYKRVIHVHTIQCGSICQLSWEQSICAWHMYTLKGMEIIWTFVKQMMWLLLQGIITKMSCCTWWTGIGYLGVIAGKCTNFTKYLRVTITHEFFCLETFFVYILRGHPGVWMANSCRI